MRHALAIMVVTVSGATFALANVASGSAAQGCSWTGNYACCFQQSAVLPALTWSVENEDPDCGNHPGHASCMPELLCVTIAKPVSNLQVFVSSTPANIQGSWESFYQIGKRFDHGDSLSVCTAYKWWSEIDRTATIRACYDHQ